MIYDLISPIAVLGVGCLCGMVIGALLNESGHERAENFGDDLEEPAPRESVARMNINEGRDLCDGCDYR